MSKKEVEKRKRERKQEKQKRRENRKESSTSLSLDNMIAYVDEFGNITDTPPEETGTEEIELDDIQISTPRKDELENEPLTGRVDFYNTEKGYGFIKSDQSVESYFFHINNAYPSIAEGQRVTYELEQGERGMNAVKVTQIN